MLAVRGHSQLEDCLGAMHICSSQALNSQPTGSGVDDFSNTYNDPGCLIQDEHVSEWYRFSIRQDAPAGIALGFTLEPINGLGEDYDFAIFGPDVDCDNLGSPVRCSYASGICAFCPLTGLGMGALDNSENFLGNGFVQNLFVNPGETYYLLVDNFIRSNFGFDLTWTGPGTTYLDCADCNLQVRLPMDTALCINNANFRINGSIYGAVGTQVITWSALQGDINLLTDRTTINPEVQLPNDFSGTLEYVLCVNDNSPIISCFECDTIIINSIADPQLEITLVDTLCLGQIYSPVVNVANGVWSGDINSLGQINTELLGAGDNYTARYEIIQSGCPFEDDIYYTIISIPSFTHNLIDTNYCLNNAIFNYSLNNLQFIETINWTFPNDVIILNGGVIDPSISLDWSNSTGGELCVEVSNDCSQSQLCVNYTPQLNSIDLTEILGETILCGLVGDTLNYQVGMVQLDVDYIWSIAGGSIVGPGQESTVNVVWSDSIGGELCVEVSNDCSQSQFCLNSEPWLNSIDSTEILGETFLCGLIGDTLNYQLGMVQLDVDYIWSIAGGTIVGPGQQFSVNVVWSDSIGGELCVELSNDCSQTQLCLNSEPWLNPIDPTEILGETILCGLVRDTLNYQVGMIEPGVDYIWSVTGGTIVESSHDSIVHVVWSDNIMDAELCVRSQNNCGLSAQFCLPINGSDIVINYDVVQPYCPDQMSGSVIISSVEGGAEPYQIFLDGSPVVSDTIDNLNPGNYLIEAFDEMGCSDSALITIDSLNLADLWVEDIELDYKDMRTIDIITNVEYDSITQVIWTPNDMLTCLDDKCTSVSILGIASLLITAELYTISGCYDSVTFNVRVIEKQDIYFPNAFTPNGDGLNDTYMVSSESGVETIKSLLIFNRWGQIIFYGTDLEPNDPTAGWDGTYKGSDSPMSVYVYQSEVLFSDGSIKNYNGDLTLIR